MVFLCHSMVRHAASDRIYSDYRELSDHNEILLLGTSRFSRSGRPNPFFEHRVNAAATLIDEGRAAAVVASGDNSHTNYNEPAQMTDALAERGVPVERIAQDYAGFRTLDSVVRMHEVFGQDDFIIVSQRFHVERALFLADAF
ncbi:MAG: YdcF family protein, partial [Spirochaetales bacterium]|nr:YdcF family protein [Spirochaetales bacterium]